VSESLWKLPSPSDFGGIHPDGLAWLSLAGAFAGRLECFGEFGGGGVFDFEGELYGVAGRMRVMVYALAAAGAFELGRQDYDFFDLLGLFFFHSLITLLL
jgi:hypothetical protein